MTETEILKARIAQQDAKLRILATELAETNRGVVALYAELDDNATQLRDAADLKSRFLSYMSHEFRTPLASISSIAHILLAGLDGSLTAEQLRQVQFVQGSVRELTEMVDDLLDLAKVEAGRITISPEWFEMVDLFSALRGMFKPIVAGDGAVALIFEEPDSVPRIYTDDRKLSQILRNFISNALKFTLEGEVRVTAQLQGDRIEFAVSDTGIGIAADHLPALFSDFAQIDTRLQKRLRGTGLGLSLAKKFAGLLGGSVSVQSEIGKGSRFAVAIPSRYTGSTAADHEGPA